MGQLVVFRRHKIILAFNAGKIGIVQIVCASQSLVNHLNGTLGFLGLLNFMVGAVLLLAGAALLTAMSLPVNNGIFQEGFQNGQECVSVVTWHLHGGLQTATEHTVRSRQSKRIHNVLREMEGNHLWLWKMQTLVKDAATTQRTTSNETDLF